MKSNIWRAKQCLVIITGASRGLGRQICVSLAQHFKQFHRCDRTHCNDYSLAFVLISRDVSALQQLSQQVSQMDCHINVVDIICGSLDDGVTVAAFEKTCATVAANSLYEQILLVHNAGSLGDVNLLTSDLHLNSTPMLNQYFELNLFSVMKMTGIFLKCFANISHRIVINITSLAAIEPFKGLSLYCIGKAGRDSFFRSVALENPNVVVLNYSPGPLETDMVSILRSDGHLTEEFQKMDVLSPETTVSKLIRILEDNKFQSGDHVDFYTPLCA